MAVVFAGQSATHDGARSSARTSRWIQRIAGSAITALAAKLSHTVFTGLTDARTIIADFESVHGPLQYTNGWWDHSSAPAAASQAFCDQLDGAAGWLYPFGATIWLPIALLWIAAAAALTWHRRRLTFAMTMVVLAAIVVVAASFSGVYTDVIAVLE